MLEVAGAEPDAEAYIRYVVRGAGHVGRATLRVRLLGEPHGRIVAYGAERRSWDEDEIAWVGRPPRRGAPVEPAGVTPDGWVEFDVSGAVDGEAAFTFKLVGVRDGRATFAARESGAGPELVLRP